MRHFKTTFLYLFIFGLQTLFGQSETGIITESKFTIHSGILNEDRTCLISFPDTYNDPSEASKKYPVIILLDGSAFFNVTTGIVHFMSSARNRNYLMPETIIIAIENVDRRRDFTVTRIETKRANTSGGGRNFLNFIEKELIPHIDKNYRTAPVRTLIGHSLGGLLTLNAYMDKNSIFDSFLAIDPSIWWDEDIMKNKVDAISPISLNKKLYIATANQGEAKYERNKKRHDAFYDLLKEKSGEHLNVEIDYFEQEDHRSVPLIALYEGLKYLNSHP